MYLSLVLFPLLALQSLVNAQSSPSPCLRPSDNSWVTYVGAQLPPNSGCPGFGIDNDPLYLAWPDSDDLALIFLGNVSANGTWMAPTFFPAELPVYGFGWVVYRKGSVQSGPAMFEFASELSPGFAILKQDTASNSTGLRPGDVRLLEPSDVVESFNQSEEYWPTADRVVLEVDPSATITNQTATLLLYGWCDPYPAIILGENVPLPPPGTALEYFLNVSLPSYLEGGALQAVVVSSLNELDNVLAVSGPFVLAGNSPGAVNTTASPPSYSVQPSKAVTLDGTSFSAGVSLSDFSNAPLTGLSSTPASATAQATSSSPSSPAGATSAALRALGKRQTLLILGTTFAIVFLLS